MVLIGRRQLRSNNSWLHNVPTLVGGSNSCTLQVNPVDVAKLGLDSHARVRSATGEVIAPVEPTETIMPGVVSLPHGWGHSGSKQSVAAAASGGERERVDRQLGHRRHLRQRHLQRGSGHRQSGPEPCRNGVNPGSEVRPSGDLAAATSRSRLSADSGHRPEPAGRVRPMAGSLRGRRLASAEPAVEQVPLPAGLGRVSALAVHARQASPRFACAAMDGIAVGWDGLWDGLRDGGPVPASAFCRVDTGDPLPAGTDTVVERERVRVCAPTAAPWSRAAGGSAAGTSAPSARTSRPVGCWCPAGTGCVRRTSVSPPLPGTSPSRSPGGRWSRSSRPGTRSARSARRSGRVSSPTAIR